MWQPGPINFYSVLSVTKELTVKGSIAYTKREFEMVIDLMSHKRISVLKFLSDTVSLDEVQGAYERLTSGSDQLLKFWSIQTDRCLIYVKHLFFLFIVLVFCDILKIGE